MSNNTKQKIALYTAKYLVDTLPKNSIIGMGTGSTVNELILALKAYHNHFAGMLATSNATTKLLLECNIKVLTTQETQEISLYIDGADEINADFVMLKGGGGALTQEKIIANMAQKIICIADKSKQVNILGKFPLPIEVIPMAYPLIKNHFMKNYPHTTVILRKDKNNNIYISDNHAYILDIHGLQINEPYNLEMQLNQIIGIISSGIFAKNKANLLITNDMHDNIIQLSL